MQVSRLMRDAVTALALLFFLWLIALKLQQTHEQRLTGPFVVIDGDTLAHNGERLRLSGLDAPELHQSCGDAVKPWACGEAAKARLAALVAEGAECHGSHHDKYHRLLVSCRTAGIDPAALLVREGFALSYGGYEAEEARARHEKRGVWAAAHEAPDQWRRNHAHKSEVAGHGSGWMRDILGFGRTGDDE